MINNNFTPFPVLATERLTLRQLTPEDANEIFIIRSNEQVLKFLDRPKAKTMDEARQFIHKVNDGITKNEWILWAITLNNQTKLIGTICFWNLSKERSTAEIGYELMPGYQGKGIMQEALTTVIYYGFENMKVHTLNAYTNPNNLKSIKLLEKNNFIKKVEFKDNTSTEGEGEVSNMVIYTLHNNNRSCSPPD